MVSEIGFDPYTSLLTVGRETLREKPEVVRKMVQASVRGWQKYLSEPAETNKYIQQQNPEMSQEILSFGVEALKPLCLPDAMSADKLGQMTMERWRQLAEQLVEVEALKPDAVDPSQAFTTEFLPSP